MTWTKISDCLHSHRKVRTVEMEEPAALALHFLALSYCGQYLTDGLVDTSFVRMHEHLMSRDGLGDVLVSAGMWKVHADGFEIHDFLEFNPSRESVEGRRQKDADRKEAARSAKSPQNVRADSAKTPRGVRVTRPDPTRPDPDSPLGNLTRAQNKEIRNLKRLGIEGASL